MNADRAPQLKAGRYASIETLGRLKVEMKKPTKVLLGLATLWPFFYLILFFVVIFSTIVFVPGSGEPGPPPLIALILPLHLFTMLASLALMVFYIVNVFRNDRVDKDKKGLWAVVLFMGNMIAMPIYWYLYIWREPPGADPAATVAAAKA